MTDEQRAIVSEILNQQMRQPGVQRLDRVVTDALLRAGVDLKSGPSLEEIKGILVEALYASRRAPLAESC